MASAILLGGCLFPDGRVSPPGRLFVWVGNEDESAFRVQIAELRQAWDVASEERGVLSADVPGKVLLLVFDEECSVVGRYGVGPGSVTIRIREAQPDLRAVDGVELAPQLQPSAICAHW